MVTTRTGGSFSALQRSLYETIIARFGRKDIALVRYTLTLNGEKQITARTSTTSTVRGDLQFVTYDDKQYLDRGIARIGDGIFYTVYSTALSAGDIITVDSIPWELMTQVEAETIGTERIYQAWIVRRRPV